VILIIIGKTNLFQVPGSATAQRDIFALKKSERLTTAIRMISKEMQPFPACWGA
jgi:hypothetical protein